MGIKYYYSAPQQIRMGYFITDANGAILYTYPNTKLVKNLPRVTVCTILDGNKLSFGFTTCSTKDEYSKKRGQDISKKRAMYKPYKVVEIEDIKDIHKISDEIIDEIYMSESKRIFRK